VFNTFPGLYQLLPSAEKFTALNLYAAANWPKSDPRPDPKLLQFARDSFTSLASGDNRFYLIAGANQATVTNLRVNADEFVYDVTMDGDGTVPLELARLSGIPTSQTYYVDESHGSLPNNDDVEKAVRDLLSTGKTDALKTDPPSIRRDVRQVPEEQIRREGLASRTAALPMESRDALRAVVAADAKKATTPSAAQMMPGIEDAAAPLEFSQLIVGRKRQQRLELRFALGSITQIDSRAYVLGLFKNVSPSGAALAIDRRLRGAITEFMARRMFSGEVGEIFTMPVGRNALRADMVVFAGMGSFDAYTPEVQQIVAENIIRVMSRTP
jgi:hypothetical protein